MSHPTAKEVNSQGKSRHCHNDNPVGAQKGFLRELQSETKEKHKGEKASDDNVVFELQPSQNLKCPEWGVFYSI